MDTLQKWMLGGVVLAVAMSLLAVLMSSGLMSSPGVGALQKIGNGRYYLDGHLYVGAGIDCTSLTARANMTSIEGANQAQKVAAIQLYANAGSPNGGEMDFYNPQGQQIMSIRGNASNPGNPVISV